VEWVSVFSFRALSRLRLSLPLIFWSTASSLSSIQWIWVEVFSFVPLFFYENGRGERERERHERFLGVLSCGV
jgi:hypothetical protein